MEILTSDWTGLHDSLIAKIYAVDRRENQITSEGEVHAPFTDVSLSSVQNWQSPFESASPDSKAPALLAMVQSGAISSAIIDLHNVTRDNPVADVIGLNESLEGGKDLMRSLEGKTGITKLNSTQIFSGSQPIKLTGTLQFRAFADSQAEVMSPIQRLLEWQLPQMLETESIINRSANVSNAAEFLHSLLPSKAPQILGITFGNNHFQKMVLESVELDLTSPKDKNGNYASMEIQCEFSSLTALDRQDVRRLFPNDESTEGDGLTWYYF